ncbi:MAG: phosphopantetheine-binding protein [Candidatus Sumerlaeota bacterium]|nr:phosphopantetheine-binding protein [Candidatus Sumerlaeota bacterium]
MTREEISEGVRACVARVVDKECASIRLGDRIIDDLGADSLDLLDLVFQLEQRFSLKISPRGIERRAREQLGGAPLEVDGIYTATALAELRNALPEIPSEEFKEGLKSSALPRLFRVETFVNLVERLLDGNAGN